MNLIPAILLGSLILVTEITRVRRLLYIDFLRGISLSFFIAFAVVPLAIHGLDLAENQRFYWMTRISYKDIWLSTAAQLIALIGYICIHWGFAIGKRRLPFWIQLANTAAKALRKLGDSVWLSLALGIEAFSLLSLGLYSLRREASLTVLLQTAGKVRTGEHVLGIAESSFTFLTWAMLGITASYILLGLLMKMITKPRSSTRSFIFLSLLVLFCLTLVTNLITLWIRAGRLHLASFIIVITLALLQAKLWLLRFTAGFMGIILFLLIFIFGKYMLGIAPQPDIPMSIPGFLTILARELSFPYLSLINTIELLQHYRGFVDIPLALLYVFGLPIYVLVTGSPPADLPTSVGVENTVMILGTRDLGEIPVDIITFGYFSAGVIGVIGVGFLLGLWLAWMERAFPPTAGGVLEVLRVAWIVFSSTVCTLYADPVNVLREGLYITFPTLIVLALAFLAPGKQVRRSSNAIKI